MILHRGLPYLRIVALLGVMLVARLALALEHADTPTVPSAVPESETTTTSASPETATGELPASEQESDGRLRIRSRRQIFSPGAGAYRFYDEVSVTKPGLELLAAELEYDATRNLMTARGDVVLTGSDGQTYRGQLLEYRPARGTWEFRDWATTLSPATLGAPVVAPLYASGEAISCGHDGGLAMAHTHLTSCDQQQPHYEIVARHIDLYPGDKLIARDVDLYVLGKRIARLPWLFFFLRELRPPVMPEFGRNDLEGYFLRLPYQYLLGDGHLGTVRLDLTEKRGVAVGVNHFYTVGSGQGEAFAYTNPDSGDYTLRLAHDQPLLPRTKLNLAMHRTRQTLFSGTTSSAANAFARIEHKTDHSVTSAEYIDNRTGNSAANLDLHTARLLVQHDRRAGDNNFSYRGEYRSTGYEGSGVANDEELWNHLLFTRKLPFADLNVRLDHYVDVDGEAYPGDRHLTRLQRLPEVTLQTDHARLGWTLPGRLTLGWGSYRERVDAEAQGRFLLDWHATPRITLGDHTTVQLNAGLRQTLYGDEAMSAQYQYQMGMNARTRLGNFSGTLQYHHQDGAGYSPFYMDAIYPRHLVTSTLQYQLPIFKLGVTAGRDLQWGRWHDIALTAEAAAGRHFTMRHHLGFDPNQHRWRDMTSHFAWQHDPRLAVNLRARYNLEAGRLHGVSGYLNWTINPAWAVQWRANYDGTKFFWNEWQISRDLHCWEAILRIDGVNDQFGLTLRPKVLDRNVIPEIAVGYGARWNMSLGMQF